MNEKQLKLKIENEMKDILGGYHIDKDKIRDALEEHLKLLNQPLRPIKFFDDYKSCCNYIIIKISAAYSAADSAAYSAAYSAADSAAYSAACECKKDNCLICSYVKILNPFIIACKNGLFKYWIMDNEIVAIINPQIRHLNGILHSEFQPAVEWKNEKYWFLNGIKFEEDMWQKIVDRTIKFEEIIKIQDVDKRTIAYKYCDIKELLKGAKAELVYPKTERGNELYKVPKGEIFDEDEYCLHYYCPSSGREYLKWVEPQKAEKMNYNADALQGDTHKFTLNEYLNKYFVST